MEKVPINISARHIHVSPADRDALFGPGHVLTRKSDLSQPGQFACEDRVTLTGPRGSIPNVRVLGPEREETQVEVSRTDAILLGIDAPLRESGRLEGTPGIQISTAAGSVTPKRGTIRSKRHVHMSPDEAAHSGVKDRDLVMVRVPGERGLIFDDVLVRVGKDYRLDVHVDTDEANAAGLSGHGDTGWILVGPTLVQPEPAD